MENMNPAPATTAHRAAILAIILASYLTPLGAAPAPLAEAAR